MNTRVLAPMIASLALWTLPVIVSPPSPGLDPAWVIGLLMATQEGWQFGRDILCTYGPLGFLDFNLYVYHKLWLISLAFNFAVHFLFVAVFFMVLAELRPKAVLARAGVFVLSAVAVVAAVGFIFTDDKLLLAATGLLYLGSGRDVSRRMFSLLGLAGVLLAVCSLMRLSSLFVAVFVVVTFTALQARQRKWAHALWPISVYLIAFLLVWVVAGQQIRGIPTFLLNGWQMVMGYSHSMGLPGLPQETLVGFLSLGWVASLVVISVFLKHEKAMILFGLTCFYYFVYFKEGFVRQDGHSLLFFAFSTLYFPMAMAALWNNRTRLTSLLLVVTLCVFGLNLAALFWLRDRTAGTFWPRGAWHHRGSFQDSWRLATAPSYRMAYLDRARREILAAHGLEPGELRRMLGDKTVDIHPWDADLAWADGLHWAPRPVFQSYSVYTPALDRLNAAYLRGAGAPERILWRWTEKSIDDRYALFDEPETLREILCRYRLETRWKSFLILRRESDVCGKTVALETTVHNLDESVSIPDYRAGYVFGRVTVRPTWLGRTKGLLLRPQVLAIELPEAEKEYRLNHLVARNGLFLSSNVRTADDFAGLIAGTLKDNIATFSICVRRLQWDFADWGTDYSGVETQFFAVPAPIRLVQDALYASDRALVEPPWDTMQRLEGGQTAVDSIAGLAFEGHVPRPFVFERRDRHFISFVGWAVDDKARDPGREVYLILHNENHRLVLKAPRSERPDVAAFYHVPGYVGSGYEASASSADIQTGCYSFSVRIVASASNAYYEAPQKQVCFH